MPAATRGYTSYGEGAAIALTRGEHMLTRTYGARAVRSAIDDLGLSFRDVLARDIVDIRSIVGSRYNRGLLDVIRYYRENFPELLQ
jgi:hypothetical protein